jgi:hypothetical protein
MAQNKRPDADGLAALSFWAEVNPADFVRIEHPAPLRMNSTAEDCPQVAGGAITA